MRARDGFPPLDGYEHESPYGPSRFQHIYGYRDACLKDSVLPGTLRGQEGVSAAGWIAARSGSSTSDWYLDRGVARLRAQMNGVSAATSPRGDDPFEHSVFLLGNPAVGAWVPHGAVRHVDGVPVPAETLECSRLGNAVFPPVCSHWRLPGASFVLPCS